MSENNKYSDLPKALLQGEIMKRLGWKIAIYSDEDVERYRRSWNDGDFPLSVVKKEIGRLSLISPHGSMIAEVKHGQSLDDLETLIAVIKHEITYLYPYNIKDAFRLVVTPQFSLSPVEYGDGGLIWKAVFDDKYSAISTDIARAISEAWLIGGDK